MMQLSFCSTFQTDVQFESIFFSVQVSRRLMHRPMLVFRQPNLLCIDGIPVSPEERTKAELYFMEQQVNGNCQYSIVARFQKKKKNNNKKQKQKQMCNILSLAW